MTENLVERMSDTISGFFGTTLAGNQLCTNDLNIRRDVRLIALERSHGHLSWDQRHKDFLFIRDYLGKSCGL